MASLWAHIVDTYDDHVIQIVGGLAVQVTAWWLPCIAYASLDTLWPAFSERHKIQPAPKQPTRAQIWDAVFVALRNQGIVLSMHLMLILDAVRQGRPPAVQVTATLPTLWEFTRDFVVCVTIREFFFYHGHRALHAWPALYRTIHKTHHRFTAPVAFAAIYAHPLEHIFVNVLPIAVPPLLLHTHILTMWVFVAWQLFESVTVHSGYDFFYGAAKMHDRHHERYNVYFGGIGIFDWLHGTDEQGVLASKVPVMEMELNKKDE